MLAGGGGVARGEGAVVVGIGVACAVRHEVSTNGLCLVSWCCSAYTMFESMRVGLICKVIFNRSLFSDRAKVYRDIYAVWAPTLSGWQESYAV